MQVEEIEKAQEVQSCWCEISFYLESFGIKASTGLNVLTMQLKMPEDQLSLIQASSRVYVLIQLPRRDLQGIEVACRDHVSNSVLQLEVRQPKQSTRHCFNTLQAFFGSLSFDTATNVPRFTEDPSG